MAASLQRQWLADALESAPSFVFLALLKTGVDLETAGWIGAGLAAAVLLGFRALRLRFNPILLGINVHLLLVTPVIVAVFWLGAARLGDTLTRYSYEGVLLTILVTGAALTLLSEEGFMGEPGLPASSVRPYSAVLLLAALAGLLWALFQGGSALTGVGLPIVALFALRRFLLARSLDGSGLGGVAVAGGAASFTGGSDGEAG